MLGVLAIFGLGGVFSAEFVEDRRKTMVPPGMNIESLKVVLPTRLLQIRANLERLEQLLVRRARLPAGLGARAWRISRAYHPLLLIGAHPRLAALLAPLRRVAAWAERVRGHRPRQVHADLVQRGHRDRARGAAGGLRGRAGAAEGMRLGDRVVILADEYGSGTVAGTLAASGLHEIAVRRRASARASRRHFPREDYSVVRADGHFARRTTSLWSRPSRTPASLEEQYLNPLARSTRVKRRSAGRPPGRSLVPDPRDHPLCSDIRDEHSRSRRNVYYLESLGPRTEPARLRSRAASSLASRRVREATAAGERSGDTPEIFVASLAQDRGPTRS